jgi:hypothetical protein
VLATAFYLPFWEGVRTLRAGFDEGGYITTSIHAAVRPMLAGLLGARGAELLLVAGTRLAFLPVMLVVARRMSGAVTGLLTGTVTLLLLYLVLASPWLMPWYALWPLAPAAALPWNARVHLPVLALTLGALLLPVATNFLTVMSGDPAGWQGVHLAGVLIMFTPLILAWAWTRRRPAHGRHIDINPSVKVSLPQS